MKNYLFVLSHMPNVDSHVQETLDMILTLAAFDQAVSLLFIDDGVWQLTRNQQAERLQLKATSEIFQALSVYDVNRIYVESESLQCKGLQLSDLSLPAQILPRNRINEFMSRFGTIIPD